MTNIIDINQRLREWMKAERVTPVQIREITGLTRSSISQIMNDKIKISVPVIRHIAETYNDLNIRWLITGNGSMRYTYEHFKETEYNNIKRLNDELERVIEAKDEIIRLLKEKINHD